MDYSILCIARVDVWIMKVVNRIGEMEERALESQKFEETFDTFLPIEMRHITKFLPTAMRQIRDGLHHWVKEWNPKNLNTPYSLQGKRTDRESTEETMETKIPKTYVAFAPVHVHVTGSVYLSIKMSGSVCPWRKIWGTYTIAILQNVLCTLENSGR